MKSKAKLVRKSKWGNNYKLTFTKDGRKEFFLVLNNKRRKIFHWLIIGRDYSFSWSKGNKYDFLKPTSIKLRPKPTQAKDIFINGLFKQLKTERVSVESVARQLIQRFIQLRDKNFDNQNFLMPAKQLIQLLFLKHQTNLNHYTLLNEAERAEVEALRDLKTMFMLDNWFCELKT